MLGERVEQARTITAQSGGWIEVLSAGAAASRNETPR